MTNINSCILLTYKTKHFFINLKDTYLILEPLGEM